MAAAMRLAMAAVRRRGSGSRVPPLEPARKLAVESRGIAVSERESVRYLAATRGAELFREGDAYPPTITALWETALILELLSMEAMPFPARGIVHLGSEMVVVRPLPREDLSRCRLEVARVEAHPRGMALALKSRVWTATDQLCQENSTWLLLRGCQPPPGSQRGSRGLDGVDAEGNGESRDWREISSWSLSGGAGLRYARASGDFNPIHLWPWSAKLLGFSRPILHGHCSLAMISHELSRATGRPLKRIDVRFRAPLELPAKVRLEVAGDLRQGGAEVRLVDPCGSGKPYVQGSWVGGIAADKS